MKKTRRLSFNPVYAVELEPEVTSEAKRWSSAQARVFLTSTKDPLGLLFRIVLLRGARRGEAVGLRWQDADLDAGYVRVKRPIVLVRGAITESTSKTKTGDRLIWLDSEIARLLKEHRKAQLETRLKAGKSWQDHDLIFCQDDGAPYKPDYVTRRFQRLAALAGLPVMKLHEGRHSAAYQFRAAGRQPQGADGAHGPLKPARRAHLPARNPRAGPEDSGGHGQAFRRSEEDQHQQIGQHAEAIGTQRARRPERASEKHR